MSTMQEVPPGRYRVIYSTMSSGSHTDFSAADDAAAWEYAERIAHGARIIDLARVQIGLIDRLQTLERRGEPQPSPAWRQRGLDPDDTGEPD